MKNAIIGCTILLLILLLTLTHLSITAKDIRQQELDKSLNNAVYTTMEQAKVSNKYKIDTDDELIAEFNKNFLSQMNSDSEIEIQVMGVNLKEGLLDINVVNRFEYPTGAKGQVSARKAIIYEETKESAIYPEYAYDKAARTNLMNKSVKVTNETAFAFNSTTQTIMGYNDNGDYNEGYIVIPKEINGVEVKEIGDNAFNPTYNSSADGKKIVLPDTVEIIGANAFENCRMKDFILPPNIKDIKYNAFTNISLNSMTFTGKTVPNFEMHSLHLISPINDLNIYVPKGTLDDYISVIKDISNNRVYIYELN